MDMKKNITLTNQNFKKTNYDILCSFDSHENNKSYIIYTDFSKDSDNHIKVYYAYYEPDNFYELKPVKEKQEIEFMDHILLSIEQELNSTFTRSFHS